MAPHFFDAEALQRRALPLAAAYRTASPFPHAVLDDFLPADVAAEAAAAFPGANDIEWDLYTDGGRTLKRTTDDEAKMPPALRQLVGQCNSGAMIRFLETLTGITGLVADPTLAGGGLHRIEAGGFLDVHADFNHHPHLDLDRRINVLLYLNPGWDPAWGGALELWDRSMQRCERSIEPVLNRCVVFDTTDSSFHGHPSKLACPPEQARCSLAFYYYSNGRPEAERSAAHSTLYQTPGVAPAPVAPVTAAPRAGRVPAPVKRVLRGAARRVARALADEPVATAAAPAVAPRNHWERLNRWNADAIAAGRGGRPNYTWSVLHAADVARTLGHDRITAIEFGVAGGNGLVALELAADVARDATGVTVDVVGFDHGIGLPPPKEYRDAPYLMEAGQFAMDEPALRARLRHAALHLGLISETLPGFLASDPAPIGFVSFDVDYHSSTVDALALFDAPAEAFLPRVLCYFDDVLGYPWGESNGPRSAIREFNVAHEQRLVDFLPGLRFLAPPEEFHARWLECMYLAHVLDHPRAADDEGVALVTQLELAPPPGAP